MPNSRTRPLGILDIDFARDGFIYVKVCTVLYL